MKGVAKSTLILIFIITCFVHAQSTRPYQFIAKIYSEAFGRIPDPSGWNDSQEILQSRDWDGTKSFMVDYIKSFYKDNEFKTSYSINFSATTATKRSQFKPRLLALYRGALNREPNQNGFNDYLDYLEKSTNENLWYNVVDGITQSDEFQDIVSEDILNLSFNENIPYYGWSNSQPVNAGDGIYNSVIDGESLQATLNTISLSGGGTYSLPEMTLVKLDASLVIPPNVTLETAGNPTHFQYAKMARIIRNSNFDVGANIGHMIILEGNNSIIRNLWIDGRTGYGRLPKNHNSVSVKIYAGKNFQIINNRFDDPPGWSFIHALGYGYAQPHNNHIGTYVPGNDANTVSNLTIKLNLFTAYGTSHGELACDGISLASNDALVYGNQLIDITDVGVVLFGNLQQTALPSDSQPWQHSIVNNNQILNAGNSCVSFFAADAQRDTIQFTGTINFDGSSFHDNTVWTSLNSHCDFGFLVGVRPILHDPMRNLFARIGINATFNQNTSGMNSINTNVVFLVSGMLNANLNNNSISVNQFNSYANCPEWFLIRNNNDALASISTTTISNDNILDVHDSYLSELSHRVQGYISGMSFSFIGWSLKYDFIKTSAASMGSFFWELHKVDLSNNIDKDNSISSGYNNSMIYYPAPAFNSTGWYRITSTILPNNARKFVFIDGL